MTGRAGLRGALRRLRSGRLRHRNDDGIAITMVVGTVFVLSLMVVATTALTLGTQRSARHDQDWNAALAAADAGLEDYLARINRDGDYWRYGNPASAYSAAGTVTLPTGADANPAFAGWVNVPGAASRAQFRYDVDNSGFYTQGLIKIRASGKVNNRVRTVEGSIGRRGFLDYLYFTDVEARDPASYSTARGDSYNATTAATRCSDHLWSGTRTDRVTNDAGNGSGTGCTILNFISGDRINGPMHSNDAVYICGTPTFTSDATTSYDGSRTSGRHYVRNLGCGGVLQPTVGSGGTDLTYAEPLTLPPDNKALINEVDPAITGGAAGCLYTGPTRITLNPGGTMDVVSPWSANGGSQWCGTGSNLALPGRGVVYVRDVPATADGYWQAQTCPSTGGNNLGYPVTVGSGSTARTDITSYGCRAGDVFVSGKLKGALTIGADNDVVITDDVQYATSGCSSSTSCGDVLGLVADNYVQVYNPYGCRTDGSNCASLDNATVDLKLDAANLAVGHSFRVQNYDLGSGRGTLTVTGSISQKFRGAVGTSSGGVPVTGYLKSYNYDWRLRYASPPHFLDPVQSAFSVKTWSELRAAYQP